MEIRTFSLDPGLTVAEVDPGTDGAWHFLPFEDRRADLFALDERYVLALGSMGSQSYSAAIFDCVERRRTNIETNQMLQLCASSGAPPTWCYSPANGSVFAIEYAKRREGLPFPPTNHLRQLSVDGSVNRRILIAPEFKARNLVAREDGRILCGGYDRIAILDPATEKAEVSSSDLHQSSGHLKYTLLRWFSPDGCWALRPHLGSVIRSGNPARSESRAGALLSRIFHRSAPAPHGDDAHPDLPGDGIRRFGLALDLFRLDPLAFERRLIVRYFPTDQRQQNAGILDALADQHDHRCWNGRDQLLLASRQDSDETRAIKSMFDQIQGVEWDPDSRGFTLALWAGEREVQVDRPVWARHLKHKVTDLYLRHVSLEGAVGPIISVPGEPKLRESASDIAIEAIKALVRERSSHRIGCAGWTSTGVAASLREMRRKIEQDGIEQLVFGDQLQFRFQVEGRLIGEKKFFEAIRAMPPEETTTILPELRQLLASFGSAARKFQAPVFRTISSGPSDHSPNALSEAALTLAMLDDTGFDALRDWVVTVDQEHDHFAAAKVFPAMARRTGFATAEAVRFGLWFFLQQWQTVKYQKAWLGLFKTAPAVMHPAQFAAAVLEEAQEVDSFETGTSIASGLANVQNMLGRTFWDRAVAAELDRQLASLSQAPD